MTMVTFSSAVSSSLSWAVPRRPLERCARRRSRRCDEEVVRGVVGIGGGHRDGEPVALLVGVGELLPQYRAEHLLGGNLRAHDASRELLVVLIALSESGEEQFVFAGEVAQQCGVGHVRAGGDVAQRGALVAVFGDARRCRPDDLGPPRGRRSRWTRASGATLLRRPGCRRLWRSRAVLPSCRVLSARP